MDTDLDGFARDIAVAEYQSLRNEILKAIEIQFQLVALAVAAFGTIVSISLTARNAYVALVFPMIALILKVHWVNHAHAMMRCAGYILAIEGELARSAPGDRPGQVSLGRPRWETYVRATYRRASWVGAMNGAIFAAGAVLAVGISLGLRRPHGVGVLLLVISGLITVALVVLTVAWRAMAWRLREAAQRAADDDTPAAGDGARAGGIPAAGGEAPAAGDDASPSGAESSGADAESRAG